MRGVEPEPAREHEVEISGVWFPPKQVFARVTDWPRTSFTTMEAQRVLKRLGFICKRIGAPEAGRQSERPSLEDRLARLESRVNALESYRDRLIGELLDSVLPADAHYAAVAGETDPDLTTT